MDDRKCAESTSNIEKLLSENDYFFSLIKTPNPKKKRSCLKCGTIFLSASYGNRTCGSCAAQNSRASIRAGESY